MGPGGTRWDQMGPGGPIIVIFVFINILIVIILQSINFYDDMERRERKLSGIERTLKWLRGADVVV